MSLSLRRPTYEFSSIAAEREFLRDAVPIGKFVNEDTNIPLKITHVNFNIERNGVKHRTHFFSWMNDPDRNVLIVRRGQPFRLTIGLSRRFCVKDSITLLFNCQNFSGANSSREGLLQRLINPSKTILQQPLKSTFGNNTKILVPIITASNYSIKSTSRWEAVCDYVASNSIQVLVQAADDCIIGTWLMSIFTEFDGVVTWFYDSRKITIHVIFNYTCKGDDVYLDNVTDRAEYVEETTGMIFGGCEHHIMVSFWTFGQFDDGVLDLAMLMLLETELTIDVSDRCRASKVAEVIAHAVLQSNQFFKNGNRHREDPWSSAARVIAKYYRTKKPVVYFEQKTIVAVLTSIFRSLGIPARPVTGYNISTSDFSRIQLRPPKCKSTAEKTSSHRESFRSRKRLMSVTSASSGATPSDVSLKVGKPANMNHLFVIENLKVFSPWVEIFMVRKDLGDHDKGWQAISNFGPASVAAIQDCNYILDYDTIAFCNQINNTYTYFNFNKRSQSLVPHNEVNGWEIPLIPRKLVRTLLGLSVSRQLIDLRKNNWLKHTKLDLARNIQG